MSERPLQCLSGTRRCGSVRFETPDHCGINVFCVHGFDATGIPVRRTVGAGMP